MTTSVSSVLLVHANLYYEFVKESRRTSILVNIGVVEGLDELLLLLARDAVQLALLLFFPALDVLVLARVPLVLAALLQELAARLLEGGEGRLEDH